MRRIILAICISLIAGAAMAEDPTARPLRVSFFVNQLAYSEGSSSSFEAGAGVALTYAVTSNWSAEVGVGMQRRHSHYQTPVPIDGPPGSFRVEQRSLDMDTYPVDLTAQYRLPSFSRFSPYVGAGMRYVRGPAVGGMFVSTGNPDHPYTQVNTFYADNRASAQVMAGAVLRLTSRAGLLFDVRRLLRSDNVSYDPLTKGSVGFTWKF